jgi:uncharacterized protein YgbK (DUF1537 family)
VTRHRGSPVVVLDDDATGVQAAAGVPVVLDTSEQHLRAWFREHASGSAYVLTNTRALPAGEARQAVTRVARAARAAWPGAELVLRGDSTLRGHLLAEYEGAAQAGAPVLLLAPAMPAAGRITRGGRHYLVRDGRLIPAAETEYARDADFGYQESDLLAWAEERTAGLLPAWDGRVVPLPDLRREGPVAVRRALADLAACGRPAACAVDAETDEDLWQIAHGVRQARECGVAGFVVRCAPPLAAMIADRVAGGTVDPPPVSGRVLLLAGSYVPLTTVQLERYVQAFPGTLIGASIAALLCEPAAEQERLAHAVTAVWQRHPVAAVATPRETPAGPVLPRGAAIARALAGLLGKLPEPPSVIVAKGGVTAGVTASTGLGARTADVAGPLAPGISLWHVPASSWQVPLVVFPGNVGGPDSLAELIHRLVSP